MGLVMAILTVFAALLGMFAAFMRADPALLAGSLRGVLPAVLGIAGAVLVIGGRPLFGLPLLALAVVVWGYARRRREAPGQRSTVRTAAIEMELDHASGRLEGIVLAGRKEGRPLSSLSLAEILDLNRELSSDSESLRLLETYLDGRFPVWRDHAKANPRDREGVAPGTSTMTKEEAYKILGLEAGASAADVRKAHRRLIQRLSPDMGGTSVLAARINEAKNVLLSGHH